MLIDRISMVLCIGYLSSLPATFLAATLFFLTVVLDSNKFLTFDAFLENLTLFFMFGIPVDIAVVTIVGLPLYIFAWKLRLLNTFTEIVGGGLIPIIVVLGLSELGWHFPPPTTLVGLEFMIAIFACGCLGGLTFHWLVHWIGFDKSKIAEPGISGS